MRSIKLTNPQYRLLEKGFENWLRTLSFADSIVYNSPAYLKAFFHFLEQNIIRLTKAISGIISHI